MGYYVNIQGASAQIAASPGYFVSTSAASVAMAAQAGYFVSTSAASAQTAASIGYFVSTNGASMQTAANVGYFVDTTGAMAAIPASVGHYVSTSAASAQIAASVGYYVNIQGASAQIAANPGYYVSTSAASVAMAASPGYFVSTSAASAQTAANVGYYVSTGGATIASAAPEGFYVSNTAATFATPARYSYIVGQLASIEEPLQNNGSAGAAASQLDITGKTLRVIGTFNSSRAINFGTTSGIDIVSSQSANLSGALINSGTLTKSGLGQLTLSGGMTGNGDLLVSAGTLQVDGVVQNNVSVAAGSVLQGSGTINSLVNRGNLILNSGSSGLRINGNLQSDVGSSITVNVSPSITPITVSGTATVLGSITYNLSQGAYQAGTNYAVLQATGGLTSSAQITSNTYAGYQLTPYINATSLGFSLTNSDLVQSATTVNRYNIAASLDASRSNVTGDMASVINSLSFSSANVADAAFNTMGASQILGYAWAEQEKFDMSSRGITNRLNQYSLPEKLPTVKSGEFNGWVNLQGMGASYSPGYLPAKQNISASGFQIGSDYNYLIENGKVVLGLSLASFNSNSQPVNGGGISASSYLYQLYAKYQYQDISVDYILGVSSSSGNQTRQIYLPNTVRTATSNPSATGIDNQLIFSKRFDLNNNYSIRPYVGIGYRSVNIGAYQEAGADSLNLAVDSFKVNAKTYALGLNASTQYKWSGYTIKPSYEFAMRGQVGDGNTTIVQQISGLNTSSTQVVNLGSYIYPSMAFTLEALKDKNLSANIIVRGDKQSDFWVWQSQLGIRYRW